MNIAVLFDGAGLARLGLEQAEWKQNLYEAIGNGVPVYMAKAFGEVYCGR